MRLSFLNKARAVLLLAVLLVRPAGAQELVTGVDFKNWFDNREYADSRFADSEEGKVSATDFAVTLLPSIGLRWEEKNNLVVGADLMQRFGEQDGKFLSKIEPVIHYKFETPAVRALAGIFPRKYLHDEDWSTAFFSHDWRFNHNLLSGVLAQWNGARGSYAEFLCDWEGMYSVACREKFRILVGARRFLEGPFWFGVNWSMLHFAGKARAPGTEYENNVVDLQQLNPCVGLRFDGTLAVQIKLGALLSAQRDRSYGGNWVMPCMGELDGTLRWRGFSLRESLYAGANMHPFFAGHTLEDGTRIPYGYDLYAGECFFRTTEKVYSRTAFAWQGSFFHDTVSVEAGFILHYDGSALSSQQRVVIGVKL